MEPPASPPQPIPVVPPLSSVALFHRQLRGPVFSLAMTTTHFFAGHHNGLISVFPIDVATGTAGGGDDEAVANMTQEIAAHNGVVRQLLIVHDSKLLSCSSDTTIKCWGLPQCNWLSTFCGHSAPVHCMALDKKVLYSGDDDGYLKMWSVETAELMQSLRCHVGPITCMMVPLAPPADDGGSCADPPMPNTVLTGSSDSLVKLVEPSTKLVHVLIKGEKPVCSLSYAHPNVLLGGSDGIIRGYNIHTANGAALYRGHRDGVNSMISFRGRLISTSDDMSIVLWNAKTWAEEYVFKGHERCVTTIVVDEPSGRLFSSGFDGTLRIWDVGSVVAKLMEIEALYAAPAKKKVEAVKGKKKK